MKHSSLFATAAAGAALHFFAVGAFGAATVSNVSFTQDGSQDVVITYDLDNGGAPAFVAFDVLTNGVPLPVSAIATVSGDFSPTLADSVADGTSKKIVWKARQDWKGNISSNATVVVSARDPGNPVGIYLRVDVSGGTEAESWPWRFSPAGPDVSDKDFLWNELWLRCVPSGSFVMGSPESELGRGVYDSDETQHLVTLTKPFFIGVTPVTRKAWTHMAGKIPALDIDGYEDYPAGFIRITYGSASPTRADTVISALKKKTGLEGFALPTEAQWEYACRADTQGVWADGSPWELGTTGSKPASSANLGALAWYSGNSSVSGSLQPHPVAQKAPNAWGLYDLHGNVWEWCSDFFGNYPEGPAVDPAGPATGKYNVRRGGSKDTAAYACRAAVRNGQLEGNSAHAFTGARLVLNF